MHHIIETITCKTNIPSKNKNLPIPTKVHQAITGSIAIHTILLLDSQNMRCFIITVLFQLCIIHKLKKILAPEKRGKSTFYFLSKNKDFSER